ncbi:MAG: hypothetical protein ACOYWZ_04175 [Bacillota bacterium]
MAIRQAPIPESSGSIMEYSSINDVSVLLLAIDVILISAYINKNAIPVIWKM